jgi:hypothetical protein
MLKQCVSNILVISLPVMLGGWIHGSAPDRFEGANWFEVLQKVPCQDIAKDGRDIRITAVLIVDGKTFEDPVIKEEDRIKELERRCPKT